MKVISLGLGVQSTALYYQSSLGELPRADYAIFADPGREKDKTYEYLEFLFSWQKENDGIPIIISSDKNLYKDLLDSTNSRGKRFSSIPSFTKNPDGTVGMLKRQCTGEYKVQVVDNVIRDLYGLKPRQRRPKTEVWYGITLDEIQRMALPIQKWKVNYYPYIGYGADKNAFKINWGVLMTRSNVIAWYVKNGLPIPPDSSCIFCPFQSDNSWDRLSESELLDAIKVDEAIRDSSNKGIKQQVFLHSSCKPLREVVFDNNNKIDWGNCSALCNV